MYGRTTDKGENTVDAKKEFYRLMEEQTTMALATCAHGQPNVRIVNFYFDKEAQVVRFSTFMDNDKVKEITENDQVAFTTVPTFGTEHVKAKGMVRRSEHTVREVADRFIQKNSGFRFVLEQAGDALILFEIAFLSATITLDLMNIATYHLAGEEE